MIELLNSWYDATPDIILDIDFSKQSVGDEAVIDQTGIQIFKPYTTSGSVISDPDKGNVYQVNGLFQTDVDVITDLSNIDFTLTAVYKPASTSPSVLFQNGDWNNRIVSGFSLSSNTSNGGGRTNECFCLWSGGAFTRLLSTGSRQRDAWRTVVLTMSKSTGVMTIMNDYTGVITSAPIRDIGPGERFGLFGSYTNPGSYLFTGLVASIKIETGV